MSICRLYVHDPIGGFVDLCYLANISVFALEERCAGYYIHGRNALKMSDTDFLALVSHRGGCSRPGDPSRNALLLFCLSWGSGAARAVQRWLSAPTAGSTSCAANGDMPAGAPQSEELRKEEMQTVSHRGLVSNHGDARIRDSQCFEVRRGDAADLAAPHRRRRSHPGPVLHCTVLPCPALPRSFCAISLPVIAGPPGHED